MAGLGRSISLFCQGASMRKADLWPFGVWRLLSETPPPNVPAVFWTKIGPLRRRGGAALVGITIFWFAVVCVLILRPSRILDAPLAFKIGSALGSYAVMRFVHSKYYTARSEFCRWVCEQDYMVCTVCAYDLSGLPGKHRCPECGAHFEKAALAQHWKDVFRRFYEGEGARKRGGPKRVK